MYGTYLGDSDFRIRVRDAMWVIAYLSIATIVSTLVAFFVLGDVRDLYAAIACYVFAGMLLQRWDAVRLTRAEEGLQDARGKIARVPANWRVRVVLFWLPWFLFTRGILLPLLMPWMVARLLQWIVLGYTAPADKSPAWHDRLALYVGFPRLFRVPPLAEVIEDDPDQGGVHSDEVARPAVSVRPEVTLSRNGHGDPAKVPEKVAVH